MLSVHFMMTCVIRLALEQRSCFSSDALFFVLEKRPQEPRPRPLFAGLTGSRIAQPKTEIDAAYTFLI